MKQIYPLTIVFDRYNGAYSGGVFTAWPLLFTEVPEEIDADDVVCASFWTDYKEAVGKGDTPQSAYNDLLEKLGYVYAQKYCETMGYYPEDENSEHIIKLIQDAWVAGYNSRV